MSEVELPGTGGMFKAAPEDFVVEEIPAYLPSGEGDHTYLFIEKRSLTTDEAKVRLAKALGVSPDDVGAAGQKDRQAITRQWLSFPRVAPELALQVRIDGVRVLDAKRHGNKLRTGHLHGNRFTIRLRGTTEGLARASRILSALAQGGMPNEFGAQRFGKDNVERGRAILRGQRLPGHVSRSQRRLYVSAIQSLLFNQYLARRLSDNLMHTAITGDVLKKTDSGGLFVADDGALESVRIRAGECVVTGPMFGHKMMAPPPESASAEREQSILSEAQLTAADFEKAGPLAEGTRRAISVPVQEISVAALAEANAVVLTFSLPPGSYATVALDRVVHGMKVAPPY